MSTLGVINRSAGVMSAMQAVLSDLVASAAEAEERAAAAEARTEAAERKVRELQRQLESGWKAEYRRGYSAGYEAKKAGSSGVPRMDRPRVAAAA